MIPELVITISGIRNQRLASSTRSETRIDRLVWSAASSLSDRTTLGRELQDC